MKKLLFFLCLGLIFGACRKDRDFDTVTTTETIPPTIYMDGKGNLSGKVTNEQGGAMVEAEVSLGGNTVLTDREGYFLFRDIDFGTEGTLVTVEKEGYFNGSTRFYAQEDSDNYLNFQLLARGWVGSFLANDRKTLILDNGVSLDFPANSVVKANGDLYQGVVEVYANWIDPANSTLTEIMPGNLEAKNQAGDLVTLLSYGMIAVELEGQLGEELNIGNGQKVTLNFPLEGEYLSSALADIPLWHFDKSSGLWQEEGEARLVGNVYQGEVSHFSFWNCCVPFPRIQLEGQLVYKTENEELIPIPNIKIQIEASNLIVAGRGYTDAQGFFEGGVPVGEELEFNVFSEFGCLIYQTTLPPMTTNTDLEQIILIDPDLASLILVSGVLVDCDNDQVLNGWVEIEKEEEKTRYYISNGAINLMMSDCDNDMEISIIGADVDAQVKSDQITVPIIDKVADLGLLAACGDDFTEFYRITIDGELKELEFREAEFRPNNSIYIFTQNQLGTDYCSLLLSGSSAGVYEEDAISYLIFKLALESFGDSTILTRCNHTSPNGISDCLTADVIIDDYPNAQGELINGSITGTLHQAEDSTFNAYLELPFSIEFSVPVY